MRPYLKERWQILNASFLKPNHSGHPNCKLISVQFLFPLVMFSRRLFCLISFLSRGQFFSGAEALSLLATPPVVKLNPVRYILFLMNLNLACSLNVFLV